jgi:RNA polymerase sigma factor (sigma-70 family)
MLQTAIPHENEPVALVAEPEQDHEPNSPATSTEDESAESATAELDAERLFTASLAATTLLTRPDEEALARKISRARKRIRAQLRRARRLTRAALADGGRGVVTPEEDFRERETVLVLDYARRALREPRAARATRLARPQLRKFCSELSAALAEYRVLRDEMVRANVRLVSMLARRYHHPTLTFLDLFQEGTLGLFRAVEKYEPERNVKFSTYAAWWIWQQLGRAADTQGQLIRTPVHWSQFRRRLDRHARGLAGENEGPVSRADLAASQGLDRERFETMAQAFHFVSTDAPVSDEDDRPLEAILPSDAIEPDAHVEQTTLRRALEQALSHLPAREGSILRQRFGLDDDDALTLDEIGAQFGVSRERVRQLESRALKQLKEVCSSQGLQDYLQ